jgi:hypothetical protein
MAHFAVGLTAVLWGGEEVLGDDGGGTEVGADDIVDIVPICEYEEV